MGYSACPFQLAILTQDCCASFLSFCYAGLIFIQRQEIWLAHYVWCLKYFDILNSDHYILFPDSNAYSSE